MNKLSDIGKSWPAKQIARSINPARVATVAIIATITGGIYAGYLWTQSPANASLASVSATVDGGRRDTASSGQTAALSDQQAQHLRQPRQQSPSATAQPVDWKTAYFDTNLPVGFRVRTSHEDLTSTTAKATTTATVASYSLSSTNVRQTDQIGVTIGNLNRTALNEIPAIKLRLSQPGTYTVIDPKTYAGSPLPNATAIIGNVAADGSYETSLFWQAPQAGRYVAVVASGSSTRKAELEQALALIVEQWQWRQLDAVK